MSERQLLEAAKDRERRDKASEEVEVRQEAWMQSSQLRLVVLQVSRKSVVAPQVSHKSAGTKAEGDRQQGRDHCDRLKAACNQQMSPWGSPGYGVERMPSSTELQNVIDELNERGSV